MHLSIDVKRSDIIGKATGVTAMLLVSAAVVFACSSDDEAPPPQPIDYDSLLNTNKGGADAHAPQAEINVEGWPVVDPGAASPKAVTQAAATLKALGSTVGGVKPIGDDGFGSVRFSATADGARVKVELTGGLTFLDKLTARVHLSGDCSGDGANAGPGYNFGGSSLDQPDPKFLMGNLAQLEVDVSGAASKEEVVRGAAIQGPYSIVGRSVVVHGKPTGPTDEGPRLACGVIGMVANAPK